MKKQNNEVTVNDSVFSEINNLLRDDKYRPTSNLKEDDMMDVNRNKISRASPGLSPMPSGVLFRDESNLSELERYASIILRENTMKTDDSNLLDDQYINISRDIYANSLK